MKIESGLQFKEGDEIFVITNVSKNSVIYTYIDDDKNLRSERQTLSYTKAMFKGGYWIPITKKLKFKIIK